MKNYKIRSHVDYHMGLVWLLYEPLSEILHSLIFIAIVGSSDRKNIESAMNEWKEYTCIDFQKATSGTGNYVRFINHPDG